MPRSPALEPPPGNPRFPLADSVRALAVLGVICCHATGISGAAETSSWGWLGVYLGLGGVAIFFALSGFLLYRPFASAHAGLRRPPSLRAYARRRTLRILPAYWAALTLLALWPRIPGPFGGHWWVYYGFGQVYANSTLGGGIPVAWSLCTEVTFYLVMPVVALVAARIVTGLRSACWWRAEIAVLVPFAASGLVGRAFVQTHDLPRWAGNTLISSSEWFAGGMALAVASVAIERRGGLPPRLRAAADQAWVAWLVAALSLVVAHTVFGMFDIHHPWSAPTGDVVAGEILFALAATFAIIPVVFGSGGAIRRLLASRWLSFVGLVSYGMYLWHAPLGEWLADFHAASAPAEPGPGIQNLIGGQKTLTLAISTVALSMLAATISYYLVELPFLRRKEGRLRRARKRVVATPALAAPDAETATGS